MTRPVALLFSNPVGGGVQRVMMNLGAEIAARNIPVDLVVARTGGAVPPLPPGTRLVDLAARRTVDVLPGLIRYLRRSRPRAVLSAGDRLNMLSVLAARLARSDTRTVVSIHIALQAHFAQADDPRGWLVRRLIPAAYRRADAIVAVSRAAAREAAQVLGVDEGRVRTIYNPVVTPGLFRRAAEPCAHPWLADGHSVPVLVGMGRLAPQKDFATLLRAFARVRARGPARLLILGEGDGREPLLHLARELGVAEDVELAGYQENPYAWLARADVFVLSSAWEGLPTVLIEAMALGVPVVSTDCPTGPAEILDGGARGELVPVGDPESLAAAVGRVLSRAPSPRARLDLPEFSVESTVREYLRVLGVTEAA